MSHHLTDIDELVQAVRNSFARGYMDESLAAFRAGAYRSSIISSWIGVCVDIIEKIRELSISGDGQAELLERKLDNLAASDFKGMQAFERELLSYACEELEFITPTEKQHLERLRDDRHICAHPSFQKDVSHFVPSAELTRLHIVQSCQYLLIHPPTKGKALLENLFSLIQEDSFPEDDEKAYKFLSSDNFLGRAKSTVVRNLLVILLKRLFRDDAKLPLKKFNKLCAAINAIRRIQSTLSDEVVKEKLSGFLVDSNDRMLKRTLPFISRCPENWKHIDEAIVLRIIELVGTLKATEIVGLRLAELASSVPQIRSPLIDRVNELKEEDRRLVLAGSPSPHFKQLAIQAFIESGSFAGAYNNGEKYLLPHAAHFTDEDLATVLTGALSNASWGSINQILHAGGIEDILQQLYEKTKSNVISHSAIWSKFWESINKEGYEFVDLGSQMADDGLIEVSAKSVVISDDENDVP